MKKYGRCHGISLLVIERLIKAYQITCHELFSKYNDDDTQRIAYFQALEIVAISPHFAARKSAGVTYSNRNNTFSMC